MTRKLYATFVLPAPSGCNLKCPFCIVSKRKEADEQVLSDEDFLRFWGDLLIHFPIKRMSIQGFEPLLPETWPLTREMLRMAARFFCETSVITNGTYLPEVVEELALLTDTLTVSLDSADPKVHDRLRGVPGTYNETIAGIRAARKVFKGNFAVHSVLFPGRIGYLDGMHELLGELGVSEWIMTPVISFGKGNSYTDFEYIRQAMLGLVEGSKKSGVTVLLSDEIRMAENMGDLYERFAVRSIAQDDMIFRLTPNGTCSINKEIIAVSDIAEQWNKTEPPHAFMKRLLTERHCQVMTRSRLGEFLLRGLHPALH